MSNDLISRKALIEEIQSFRCSLIGMRSGKGMLALVTDQYRKSILQIIEDQPKVGEWIPVEERLPKKDGIYLTTLDGEITGENKPFTGMAEFEEGKWIDDEKDFQCILAWMPLPEPYKRD